MYRIEVDEDRKLVRVELAGFFSESEVQNFRREEQAAVKSAGFVSGGFDLLVKTPGKILQAQEVIEAFQAMARGVEYRARRVAIAAEGTLLRMQLRRIVGSERSEVFATVEEAENWLTLHSSGSPLSGE